MEGVDLSNLELGPLDADDDRNLPEYFVSFGEFEALEGKSKFFVVGAKGSGKSAIRRFVFDRRRSDGHPVISIDDAYSVPLTELETSSAAEIKNKMKAYITGIVIQNLLESPAVQARCKNELKQFKDSVPLIQALLKSVKIKPPYCEIAMSELLPEKKRGGLFRIFDPSISDAIVEALGDDDIWLLVDDVHRVFTSQSGELLLRFIEGLIYATSDLAIQTFDRKVFIVLFLRSEIYDELALRAADLDKELQYMWHIVWDADELARFLAERIRWALDDERRLETWEYWSRLFDAETRQEASKLQQYLIERVINGPRDLLLLVDRAREIAAARGASRICLSDIEESEFEYGEEKLNQINRNFRHSYDGIKQVLDHLFRKSEQTYSRSDLEQRLNDRLLTNKQARQDFGQMRWLRTCTAFRLLKILYRVGFIGYWDPAHCRYVYVLEKASPDRALVGDTDLKIHSAFDKYLELRVD